MRKVNVIKTKEQKGPRTAPITISHNTLIGYQEAPETIDLLKIIAQAAVENAKVLQLLLNRKVVLEGNMIGISLSAEKDEGAK